MLKHISIAALTLLIWVVAGTAHAQEAQTVVVQQTDIKRVAGEVVSVRGNLMTLRHDDDTGRASYRIPRGASITIAGEQIRLQDLQPGQRIRVYYRETTEGRVIVISPPQETEQVVVIPEPEPAPMPEPAPEPEPVMLPTTASFLPLTGLLGLVFTGIGAGIGRVRRRRT